MIRTYPKDSLGYLLFCHDNDYSFDAFSVSQREDIVFPSLSVAIPYYEAKNTINLTLECLLNSIKGIKEVQNNWQSEVIVIDDGSVNYPAKKAIKPEYLSHVRLINLPQNLGRFAARNVGIKDAKYDFMIFSDADILVNKETLMSHLNIYTSIKKQNKNVITASVFNFIDLGQITENNGQLFNDTNDFRVDCTYHATWIGCEDDKQFVGSKYQVLEQTNNFRNWSKTGMLGPWALSNMVLGGFFGFSTELAKQVGGCDRLFSDYGFEETSLATKLIALHDSYVVPVLSGYAIHVSDPESTLPQSEKNRFFQKAHALYFKEYLYYDKKQATKEKI